MRRWIDVYGSYNWPLLLTALALTAIGLFSIYGIGISRATPDLFQFNKQLLAAGIGTAIALTAPLIDYRHLRSLALPIYLSGAALLGSVLLIGVSSRNAGRWFVFGALSFQPVELAKITFAILLAAYFARYAHRRLSWSAFFGSGIALGIYVILILLQPDFGSAMVLVAVWGAAVLLCGLPRNGWWTLLLSAVLISVLAWTVAFKPYQRDRITSFFHPAGDPYGASYNVTQARIAIGSGGWFGKGIGEGSQARLRFLPEASTDFIFAVFGEELGFVGLTVILSLFGFLLYTFIRIARAGDDPFASILLVTLAAIIATHLFVNAGMNLGIMPVTGIPLPFSSAAASSLVTMFLAVGIAESIAVSKRF